MGHRTDVTTWYNREMRKTQAVNHTNEMVDKYAEEIKVSSANTHIMIADDKWSIDDVVVTEPRHDTVITLSNIDTVAQLFTNCISNRNVVDFPFTFDDSVNNLPLIGVRDNDTIQPQTLGDYFTFFLPKNHMNGDVCINDTKLKYGILNFASFNHPGGKFIDGSFAQEEALCHSSFLYNVLKEQTDFYEYNNDHKTGGLYMDRALYTPDVIFEDPLNHMNVMKCDVITCAAPNAYTVLRYKRASNETVYKTMKRRIDFILSIAKSHNIDVLYLGAYGCGVFGNNPYDVMDLFLSALESDTFKNVFLHVVFPVPSDHGDRSKWNYNEMKRAWKNHTSVLPCKVNCEYRKNKNDETDSMEAYINGSSMSLSHF